MKILRYPLETVLCCLLAALTAVVFSQVIARYVLQAPLSYSEELARFLLMWLSMLSAAYAFRMKSHFALRILVERLPEVIQRKVSIAVHVTVTCFFLLILYQGSEIRYWCFRAYCSCTSDSNGNPLFINHRWKRFNSVGECKGDVAGIDGTRDDVTTPFGYIVATAVVLVLFVALLTSVPIAVALGLASLAGLWLIAPDALVLLPQKILSGIDAFTLLAIPLFILAGTIMGRGGIARRIVNLALIFVGRVKGGLGFVVILSTMFFSGVCGSASADTAAIGSTTMPEMLRRKYPKPFATALLAASGATASIIPPSIDLIIIGVVSGISIGGLFAAGLLPGAFNAIALMALCYFYGRRLDLPVADSTTWSEKMRIVADGSLAILMPMIILGGILGGIFTPTEASAIAVVYGLIVSLFVYKELSIMELPEVFLEAARLTGMVMLILGMASAFSFVLAFERIPHELAALIVSYADRWVVFVIIVNIVFFLLGMIMDALPALIILMPILVPAGVALGMEPIHIGIFVAANVTISLFTPPVGVCLFVACGLSKLPIEAVFRPLLPFLAVLLLTLLTISYVPEITLFIPRLLGYVADG